MDNLAESTDSATQPTTEADWQQQRDAEQDTPPPARGDVMDMLYQAWCLIANVGVRTGGGWDGQDPEWVAAATRWRDRWHQTLDQRPRAAVVEIMERLTPAATHPDVSSHGVLSPNTIRINGIPLLVDEDGPVVEEIDMRPKTPNGSAVVLVRLRLFASRVIIAAERQ